MPVNKWLGVAQPRVAVKAFQPTNVSPGTLWLLRVGGSNYQFSYSASIVEGPLSDQDQAKVVCDGLVDAYSGGGLGGGSTQIVESLTSELVNGKWAVVARGTSDGAPIDVEVSAVEATASAVKVVELQTGRAAQNEKQIIKWPKTPTAGLWQLQYRDKTFTLPYNTPASMVAAAAESMTGAGIGDIVVTGDYIQGYTLEFGGALAGQDVDLFTAYSNDSQGTSSVAYEVTQRGGLARSRYTLSPLGNDSEAVFQFTYEGEVSHYITGASNAAQIQAALESIPALTGNVDVNREQDGSFTIALVSALVGEEAGELSIAAIGSDDDPPELELTAGATDPVATVVRIKVLGLPGISSGTVTFSYQGVTTAPLNIATLDEAAILASFSTYGFPWLVTDFQKVDGKPIIIELTANPTRVSQDAGIVSMTASTFGCDAIEVRTIQKAYRPRNAIQQVALHSGPDGGTFTLTYGPDTTAGIAYNASAATIQTALEGLTSIGAGNVDVDGSDGGPWVVTFQGALAATTTSLLTGSGAGLTIVNAATATTVEVQSPTGPNWWTNLKNWSQQRIPNSTDTVVFEANSVPCHYGISNVPAIAGLDVYRSYTGQIGLPEARDDGSAEQLPQYLSLSDLGSKIAIRIGLGDDGDGPSILRIDTQSQEADVSVLYSSQATAETLYTIGLAGDLATVQIGTASVIFSSATGQVTTIDTLRFAPTSDNAGDAVVEWGEAAEVLYAEISAGSLRCGSVPRTLIINGGAVSVRGDGDCQQIAVRNATLRYLASGEVGKQGVIASIAGDGDNQMVITSIAHGLQSGDLVFVRGIFGYADRYFVIDVADSNTFTLIGSDATSIAGGSLEEFYDDFYDDFFDQFFGSGSVPSNSSDGAKWGLADAVRIGVGGTIDFSELGAVRYAVAPMILQADSAIIRDPLITIADLRWHCDPGFLDEPFGSRMVFKREQSVAVSYNSASFASNGGGVVGG